MRRTLCNECGSWIITPPLLTDRERAVIEAAKAWHAEHKEHDNDAIGMAIVNLARAAEALEAAEQEGE